MKNLIISLVSIFLLLAGFISAQSDSSDKFKPGVRSPAELELVVKIKHNGAIGFANCFEGTVLGVNRGDFKESNILITVLAGDKINEELFYSGGDSTVYVMNFVFNKSNEPYNTAYITGFVDSGKNSWRLISAYKKN